MARRLMLFRASWTLIDQAIVSLGTFAANIILARNLNQADYGTFALIFSLLLLLQVVNMTLVFYPHTIRIAEAEHDRDHAVGLSIVQSVAITAVLCIVAGSALYFFAFGRFVLPVIVWFAAWQAQETLRRMLFSELRHREAILGDLISYVGQGIGIMLLLFDGMLTLPKVFAVMAVTSGVAALIQYMQVSVRWPHPYRLLSTFLENWQIGRWSLASSVTTTLRINGLFWLIALTSVTGSEAVAHFQAALNVANLVNPILFGLCNLIPPTAAQASQRSVAWAWHETRQYASLGFLPTVAYFGFVMSTPFTMLHIFYGSSSEYLDVGLPLRILGAVFIMNYICEMITSFMHGISAPRFALNINLLGFATTLVVAVPLVLITGWVGACWALLVTNIVRLVVSYDFLKRVISNGHGAGAA